MNDQSSAAFLARMQEEQKQEHIDWLRELTGELVIVCRRCTCSPDCRRHVCRTVPVSR
jgi:hypothetical protein